MPVRQNMDEDVEVMKEIHSERVCERSVEQVDVPVPRVVEPIAVEETLDVPIPQAQERSVEVDEAVTNQNSVKKCLEMFAEIADMQDDHKFYKQFDRCMKLGILEGCTNRTEIAELLRSNTSKFGDEQTDLKKVRRPYVTFPSLGKFSQEGS